jgi:hypothetical protein
MEGIILGLEALVSPWSIIAGLSLLAIAVGGALFDYMSEEEMAGRRLHRAEWPIPGAGETSFGEERIRLAA